LAQGAKGHGDHKYDKDFAALVVSKGATTPAAADQGDYLSIQPQIAIGFQVLLRIGAYLAGF